MSIVHGTPKGSVWKLCLTKKFWLLKDFNDENLLNKKSEFIRKCRHENKLLVKSVEKDLFLYCCIILVFLTKDVVFRLKKLRKKYLKIVEKHETESSIMNQTEYFHSQNRLRD